MLSNLPGLKIRGILTMFIGCTRHSLGSNKLQGYERLRDFLIMQGFKIGSVDTTLFIKDVNGDLFICQIYVDDIIFGSTNDSLSHEFATMIGELTFFLGFQVKQMKEGTFIHQEKYTKDILKKFKMMSASQSRHPWQLMGILTWMWTVNRLINPSIVL